MPILSQVNDPHSNLKSLNPIAKSTLKLLSRLFLYLVKLRVWLFKQNILPSHTLPGKTISVGNIQLGGTGKTPVTVAIARHLMRQHARPVIVTRGYKSDLKKNNCCVLYKGKQYSKNPLTDWLNADEAQMQTTLLPEVPIIVGAKRWKACEFFLSTYSEYKPTHWLLEDGFQHLHLKRDIDLVLIDASTSRVTEETIPYGYLREPFSHCLRATHIAVTKGDKSNILNKLPQNLRNSIFDFEIKSFQPKHAFSQAQIKQNSNALLLTGIADAMPLKKFLLQHKFDIVEHIELGDHAPFPKDKIRLRCQKADTLITTRKDLARDPEFFKALPTEVYIADIEAIIPESFLSLLS